MRRYVHQLLVNFVSVLFGTKQVEYSGYNRAFSPKKMHATAKLRLMSSDREPKE